MRFCSVLTAAKLGAANRRDGVSITFLSGAATMRPGFGRRAVPSALASMVGSTHALAAELAPIRINFVVPDVIHPDLWRDMPVGDRKQFYARVP